MVMQAIALRVVRGYLVAIDSTAFKAYSIRDASNTGRNDKLLYKQPLEVHGESVKLVLCRR